MCIMVECSEPTAVLGSHICTKPTRTIACVDFDKSSSMRPRSCCDVYNSHCVLLLSLVAVHDVEYILSQDNSEFSPAGHEVILLVVHSGNLPEVAQGVYACCPLGVWTVSCTFHATCGIWSPAGVCLWQRHAPCHKQKLTLYSMS